MEEKIFDIDRLEIAAERLFNEAPRRLDSSVQIDRGDHRFEQIRQQRLFPPPARLFLPHSQVNHLSHAVRLRFFRQTVGTHQIGLDLRERPFVELGKTLKKHVADDEAENGIAEELERLVIADILLPGLVGVRLVGEAAREEIAAAEGVSDALLEYG